MVRCDNCGEIVSSTAKYCLSCGAPMNQNTGFNKRPDKKEINPVLNIVVFFVAFIVVFALIYFVVLGDFGGSSDSDTHYIEIEIDYSGSWSGSLMINTEYSSFDSFGYKRVGINMTEGQYYSLSAQKMEMNNEQLTVRLYSDGQLVKSAFTTSEYGIASVSYIVE